VPVNLLFCEGSDNSPDVRILGKIMAGICEVRPLGSKYGMGERIKARREVLGETVYGVLDRDFVKNWSDPHNMPVVWESGDKSIMFGWYWERKEIENYLIDPIVVEKAMGVDGPDMQAYKSALEEARKNIAVYQAARTALSTSRIRFTDLPSAFGKKRGKEKHLFPDNTDENNCERGIEEVVAKHQLGQSVKREAVIDSFQNYLQEYQHGGFRHQYYLHAFAGKDLLWAMNDWFIQNSFSGAENFREKILSRIQKTTDNIVEWLPEWDSLQKTVLAL
jgi:hypothetical protein